jgi:hypothetical protein
MDSESLAQIQRIVTTAVSDAEGRLRQELGDQTGALAASLRQEFREGIAEVKRHSGVLYEDVLHKIDLVVEGQQALHQRIDRLETSMEREFLETRSFMQLSYRQL